MKDEISLDLPDAEATKELGKKLGECLPAGSVILLEGDLGAGKTTLVQGIGEGLGIEEAIESPTFTLINEYEEGRLPLYHIDLYRLEGAEINELYLERYWEAIEVPPGITAIEWAPRLRRKPANYLEIQLIYLPGEGRKAKIRQVGTNGRTLVST
jgi:tRNA threonylcarbamoyladenosine biosynthesis protein TsaE